MTWPPFEEDRLLVMVTRCVAVNHRTNSVTYELEMASIPARYGFPESTTNE